MKQLLPTLAFIGLILWATFGCSLNSRIIGYANKPQTLPKKYRQCRVYDAFKLDNAKDAIILDCPWGQDYYTVKRTKG